MNNKRKLDIDLGIKNAIELLEKIPKGSEETYITGVLIVFWGALWGSFGSEYATGFIEAQLNSMRSQELSNKLDS